MKRIRANQFMFFIDAWLVALRALRDGEPTTKYVMDAGAQSDVGIEFEIRITKVGGQRVGGRQWRDAFVQVSKERGK